VSSTVTPSTVTPSTSVTPNSSALPQSVTAGNAGLAAIPAFPKSLVLILSLLGLALAGFSIEWGRRLRRVRAAQVDPPRRE
jgi:hypothetical protein